MARTFVLDTGTKGTGASIRPLDEPQKRPEGEPERLYVPPKRKPRPAPTPKPRVPRRFQVVEVVSREILGEDLDTRATLEVLRDLRSVVDVRVSVWNSETEAWRLLTLGEQRALWDARQRS
jgi:hypothetical protein